MYGHIKQLTDEFVKGLTDAGCAVSVFQAPELLSEEVLGKVNRSTYYNNIRAFPSNLSYLLPQMHAPGKDTAIPLMDYAAIQTLPEFDGIAFGIPTRY